MNKLSTDKRCAVVSDLIEGCSIRSTVRMTGVAKNTVAKLLLDLGQVCSHFQHRTLRNPSCKRLELDEIWSFCYLKQKNAPTQRKGEFGYGDVWTWVAAPAMRAGVTDHLWSIEEIVLLLEMQENHSN